MTTQTAVLAAPTGLTLTAKLFTLAAPDTVYKTANSVTYGTNDTGEAVAAFTDVAAGDYKVVYFSGARWVARGYRTFAGTNGETATETPIAAELDPATLQKIDQILEDTSTTLPAQIAGIEGGGGGGLTGPYTRTITVTDADTDEPIENPKVRFYRPGHSETQTPSDGIASFTVEAATWSYAITASGYTGVSGSVVVSANGDTPIALTPNSITPPSNPSLSAIVVLCLDAAGQPEPDVDIDIRIVTVPSGSQNIAYKGAKQTATSDDDGIARFEVVQGSVCEWKRGKADVWSRVMIDSDSVTNVTSVIGSP
jgi:hypothetical protein